MNPIPNIKISNIHHWTSWWTYRLRNKEDFINLQNRRKIVTKRGYSYKPFDDKKAIFVHIPKCAGVSISKAIFGNLAGGHTTFRQYQHIFDPNCMEEYFKFTIVRNPWDRLVSAYFFLKGGGFGELDRHWFDGELAGFSGFDDFVRNWVNASNIWKWYHFRPQHYYITDNRGRLKLDFIGRLENLEEDFSIITKRIGCNPDLPVANESGHDDYRQYYTDATKKIVADAYSKDIDLLGYRFGNSVSGRSA